MRDVHSTLLFRWFNEVWNQGHEAVIDELVHPEATIHGLASEDARRGPAAFREFYRGFCDEFTDIHISVDKAIADEDHEAALCTATATQRLTGTPVRFSGICMVHLEDGQIYEGWNHFDFVAMQQQLAAGVAAAAQ
ncbi:hypothetical protein GCM10027048_42660 [Hymenobacter coalescens]